MRVTLSDFDDILTSIKATGKGIDQLDPAITDLTVQLNEMITKSELYSQLCRAMATTIMAHGIEKAQVDPLNLTGNAAQMGFMSGVLVGFQLGLREAGLELGIGATSAPFKDDSK